MVQYKNMMCILVLISLATLCSSEFTRPNSEQLQVVSNALKYLQGLDAYYSEMSRPRLRSAPDAPSSLSALKNTLKFYRLQKLEKMFDSKGRPRFGKRFGMALNDDRPIDQTSDSYEKSKEIFRGSLDHP